MGVTIQGLVERMVEQGKKKGKTRAEIEQEWVNRLTDAGATINERTPLANQEDLDIRNTQRKTEVGLTDLERRSTTDATRYEYDQVISPAQLAAHQRKLELLQQMQQPQLDTTLQQEQFGTDRLKMHIDAEDRRQSAALQAQQTQNIMNLIGAGLLTFID